MQTILFLAATEPDGSLSPAALEALGQAVTLKSQLPDASLTVGIFGASPDKAANQIAGCGATKFLIVSGDEFEQARFATDATAAEALCRGANPALVIAPATSRLNRMLAAVAHRLNGRIDTHITGLSAENGSVAATRWYYRQRMEAVLQRAQRPWFLALDPGSFPAWQGTPGTASVETIAPALSDGHKRTSVQGLRQLSADAQTIRPEADILFVAGAGWTKKQADGQTHTKDAETLILDFLKRARASLGSSKSLVDLGSEGQTVLPFLTHLNQVGQTGSTPRHPKGLATCCHGEEPHTVGWRFINERRAVNLDPNCGWARGKADVLYVADAFAVMRKVNELLV